VIMDFSRWVIGRLKSMITPESMITLKFMITLGLSTALRLGPPPAGGRRRLAG